MLANSRGEELVIGYDQPANAYYVDRRKAGNVGFSDKFAGRHSAPRRATTPAADLTLLFDASSVELFADQGLTVLTELFFPNEVLSTIKLRSDAGLVVEELSYAQLAADAK